MRSDVARVQSILDPTIPAPIEGVPVTTVAVLEARIHKAHSELADLSRRSGDLMETVRDLQLALDAAKEIVAAAGRA